MKRLVALATVVALAMAGIVATTAVSESNSNNHKSTPPEARCLLPSFEVFSAKVWAPKHWDRKGGNPPKSTIEAAHRRIGCAPTASHRTAMKHTWKRDRARFFERRKFMHRKREIEPYYGCTVGGCDWWAIPAWSVNCESGGGVASSNLYGNTQTYVSGSSKWEQSKAAYNLMADFGGGYSAYEAVFLAWESGCAGWPG